jgi:protein NrfD
MSLSTILFLFLLHFGIGIVFTLPLVGRTAGVKFFRFNAGLAAMLIVAGYAFRPDLVDGSSATLRAIATAGIIATETALVVYWATIGRTLAKVRPALMTAMVAGGLVTLVAQGLDIAAVSRSPVVLTIISFLTSACILGGACTAMILGHWYLVIPSMDVGLLQSMVRFHIGSVVVRAVVVAAAVILAIASWEPGATVNFERYVLSSGGIFFWQRVLFGLAGPLVLSYLTWETAKIRSTQSATGILYVDLFTVMVGEILAKYLLMSVSVPV